jgi:membrane protease YdiL (CAAX protease family)
MGPTKVLYTFCVGLMMSTAYALTGNLWPLIVAHFLIDFGWLGSAP